VVGRCGGCQYQHAAYPHQLAIKEKQLRDLLRRIGGVEECRAARHAAVAAGLRYRNKITLHAGKTFGFVALDNCTILPVDACPIGHAEINRRLRELRDAGPPPRGGDLVLRGGPGGATCGATSRGGACATMIEEEILGRALRVPLTGFFQVNRGGPDRS